MLLNTQMKRKAKKYEKKRQARKKTERQTNEMKIVFAEEKKRRRRRSESERHIQMIRIVKCSMTFTFNDIFSPFSAQFVAGMLNTLFKMQRFN